MHVTATNLGGDTAPKILRGDDLDRAAASSALEGGATGGKSHDKQQKDPHEGTWESQDVRERHSILLRGIMK